MAKNKLTNWAKDDLSKFGGCIEKQKSERGTVTIAIYTNDNKYALIAKGNYLGCVATKRKANIDEGWFRGSDLADGSYTKKTWNKILADIVAYELKEL